MPRIGIRIMGDLRDPDPHGKRGFGSRRLKNAEIKPDPEVTTEKSSEVGKAF